MHTNMDMNLNALRIHAKVVYGQYIGNIWSSVWGNVHICFSTIFFIMGTLLSTLRFHVLLFFHYLIHKGHGGSKICQIYSSSNHFRNLKCHSFTSLISRGCQ
jgi:hypothetical protein